MSDTKKDSKTTARGRLGRILADRWKPILLVGGVLVLVVIVVVVIPAPNRDAPETPPPPTNVTVVDVQPIDAIEDTFTEIGTVEPRKVVRLSAEVAARVERYAGVKDRLGEDNEILPGPAGQAKLDEGMPVRVGQPILYLNTDLYQAEYDLARSNVDLAKNELDRVRQAYERNVATKNELDSSETAYKVARAKLATAKANLNRTRLASPIDGILNRLPIEEGEYVTPGQVLAEIVDLDVAKIVLYVSERDIGFLEVGQAERVLLDPGNSGAENVTLVGKITYISEVADRDSHTTRVEVSLPNRGPDGEMILRDGQIVYVQLLRRVLQGQIRIPLDAVIPLEKGYVAYVVEDGLAVQREVAIDPSMFTGRQVLVKSGLAPGDRLIVDGNRQNIGPGQPVRVIPEQDAPGGEPTTSPVGPAMESSRHPAAGCDGTGAAV
jgi:membrane fusion protein (multidrug efflux system)